jgi:hypothetical protein
MYIMSYKVMVTLIAVCFFACTGVATAQLTKNPSPELVGQLTKRLSITPQQATGGSALPKRK